MTLMRRVPLGPTNLRPAEPLKRGIEQVRVEALRPHDKNARTHSTRQIKQIARSIERFGFLNPILIDGDGKIICGHGRVAGAKILGLTTIPALRTEHLSREEIRAYALADNKLAENAGWSKEILAIEFQGLLDLDFDIELTGFELPEIEMILEAADPPVSASEDDEVPRLAPNRVITKRNDLWQLGDHRLLCGDARRRESFAALLSGKLAQLVFTDPPFNVPIRGHVSGKGRIKHREFLQASGEKTSAQFTKFLEDSLGLLAEHSADGSVHFVCMDWRHLDEMLAAGRRVYRELKNVVVWAKTNAGMGSLYRSQHELIFVWKHGRGRHVNNVELGAYGRNRSNVWTYAGSNSFGLDRLDDLAMHPTVKPVALVADAIRDCSRRGDLVLDGFAGSGSTLIGCERTDRKARVIELDPIYCDQIVRRWQKLTGRRAVNALTGLAFNADDKSPREIVL
jgi:DNA modification methylase